MAFVITMNNGHRKLIKFAKNDGHRRPVRIPMAKKRWSDEMAGQQNLDGLRWLPIAYDEPFSITLELRSSQLDSICDGEIVTMKLLLTIAKM